MPLAVIKVVSKHIPYEQRSPMSLFFSWGHPGGRGYSGVKKIGQDRDDRRKSQKTHPTQPEFIKEAYSIIIIIIIINNNNNNNTK